MLRQPQQPGTIDRGAQATSPANIKVKPVEPMVPRVRKRSFELAAKNEGSRFQIGSCRLSERQGKQIGYIFGYCNRLSISIGALEVRKQR